MKKRDVWMQFKNLDNFRLKDVDKNIYNTHALSMHISLQSWTKYIAHAGQ